ncbi:MAG: hypothetical protein OWQ51_11175 [Pyrobaculum arsenaticum]|uniref:Uncharacterized protein n=2 Tax=Pyrobaculum arsenaticum TaxID=121277 RepID=A4WN32_PYRAR|nr:hypothetical protein [Pyrobaculum arsenaticum]ABP51799.1 hypothetical protein Pars_2253 [Pyrobaculum arsenaticum DSM 13514]MCY0891510.1 hypothetical protein [Pyrobaculum arsenaticum]NYR16117.1 hypothetical protein [Pyrobaculum arsenaticum]
MKLYILFIIIVAVASIGLAFTYFASQAKADRYLVIAHFPPHLAGSIDKALEEVKKEAQWASWFGDAGLAVKKQRDEINKALEEWGIGRDEEDPLSVVVNERGERQKITHQFAYRIYRKDGKIVVEIRQRGKVIFNYTTDNVEDAFWTLLEKGRELNDTLPEILYRLIEYKYDLPLTYSAFAIPFCNGTYYGPDVKPLRAVIDGSVEVRYFVENRTIIPLHLPETIIITNVTRVGEVWLSKYYVVDACALPKVNKRGVIAIVHRDKLNSVVKILEKYLGEEPVVLPIS